MYKLLIFDWDGTVIDSTARIVSSMQAAARDLSLPSLEDHEAREIIGLGLPEAIRQLFPGINDDMIEPMRERYAYYYLEGDNTPTALFAGVQATLEALRDRGYRLAVATGKSRKGLDRVLAQTGLGSLFEITRCADETTSKPDPHMLHEILAETGVAAEHALMVGDTEFDMEMAQRANVGRIAVSYGAHHIDRLGKYEPVLEVHAFAEIARWLETVQGVCE
ncbi:HAD-IA family hydrolase [Neptunomonas sp. XY-337]|uniref:HAD-IA family hydrolase n=1 Tax=Neptunomonas sp. XY-337 TaxID=2561897 RepID=UPI0010AAE15C|nr:HAD-IA family hydrolase [Neptunomonas sp. XY-337]